MKAYCITLKGCGDRQQHITQVMSQTSLELEFFYGVDARTTQHPLLDNYNKRKYSYRMGREAAIGELGCYASHYLIWQKCIEENEPILVLEDDLNIDVEAFERSVEITKEHINECGYIRLENTGRKILSYATHNYDNQDLVKFLKVPQCTTAYAISPKAAKAFLESSDEFLYPVDVFLRNVWVHKQPMFGIWQAGLWGGNKPSLIGDRKRKGKKDYTVATMRLLNKAKSMLLNLSQNIRHLFTLRSTHAPTRFVRGE
ncbi:glycosyltransferase [Vibrio astriarenae]|uniref:Glycosyltransferase n=1 Tax=Vibrio astriarenae TaxID=1481923 RepID=A0A7Z2T5D3_9VIBR|nr:glycosyltransferase family 25 protein [Vibrio astriarenae]QIA64477.1 glycosyltransferase [Vibrio astriarenae]